MFMSQLTGRYYLKQLKYYIIWDKNENASPVFRNAELRFNC